MATHMILHCFVSHRTDYVYVCRRRINLPKHLLSGEEDPSVSTSPMGAEENDASVAISVKATEVTTRVE
jgi:surfactin synthase thioesterase subunit